MCGRCVRDPNLCRGSFCSESGTYLLNFKSCHGCGRSVGQIQLLKVQIAWSESSSDTEEDNDGITEEEEVSFQHVCSMCKHVVATHVHRFWLEDGYQEYRMDCLLCGLGEDSISVKPRDPRKASRI